MGSKRIIYAAYGSNMNIEQMKKRCPKAQLIGTGTLKGYHLTFRGKKHGVANIEKNKNGQVPIVLWEITRSCEGSLDFYEGFPTLYVKKWISVNTEKGEFEAMAYVMTDGYEVLTAIPYVGYCKIIEQGYEQNGIEKEPLYEALQNTYREVTENRIKTI